MSFFHFYSFLLNFFAYTFFERIFKTFFNGFEIYIEWILRKKGIVCMSENYYYTYSYRP